MTREEAIKWLETFKGYTGMTELSQAFDVAIKALQIEPLTDKEHRIFLAAMSREEKVCKEVDEEYPDREPYEDSLVSVCRSIEMKVKKVLWS